MTGEQIIEALIDEYQRWLRANQLQHLRGDASELIMNEGLSEEQVVWLSDFIDRWNQAEEEL